ncbi:hypothetical protein [Deinococcus yavapaiensis]|uniref:Uncharacterized protein n=1 Tax=Deinococcus yavapaiensis KR-236 TaxID=694435 RepID=A0A318S9A7_9DEIO|nr:hypothetical protein [Deinococcus yavapaiensis]PYE55720.1 hypothetical protein DES52_10283 [Deinococcus yavapaiensis KR-236]
MEVLGMVLVFVALVAFLSSRVDRRGRRVRRRLYASSGSDGVIDTGWSDATGSDGCDTSSSDGGGSDGGGCGGE